LPEKRFTTSNLAAEVHPGEMVRRLWTTLPKQAPLEMRLVIRDTLYKNLSQPPSKDDLLSNVPL